MNSARQMLASIFQLWCFLCGSALGIAGVGIIAVILHQRVLSWIHRARYRRGADRRHEIEQAIRVIMSAVRSLDDRSFSLGVWKVNHYMPPEDEQARNILLAAWRQLLEEV